MVLTRRQILEFGSYGFLVLGAGTLLPPGTALGLEWGEWLGKKHQGGTAKVLSLKGMAQADQKPLEVGRTVAGGQKIEVASGGELVLLLPDAASFKITGPAALTLEVEPEGGGLVNLVFGGILGVIPKLKNRAYMIQSASATLGIKGTVFYKEVFGPQGSGDARVPAGALEYFCICNGSLDVLSQGQDRPILSDHAEHHHAHVVVAKADGVELVPAGFVKGHDDAGIHQVIEANPLGKHDQSWLQL
ncbi:MAG: hypothetical protein A2600_09225 [Candidatus Lambdaproteobacteria bacterium RIFOXYD1_FULL_56_27]|uniref:FecR protein domain-containing protein n=1 Tax=Candidatus Lambdaproteobacteria bacterium RIFOXYD2_FULL_56_26 TaxID=1817773 RepID=A0A1F6GL83_9PROT|nr:MAG: hypothetical protein A2557_13350 [Candidatus Lambdaproteobacteria bacterium RIFOXYD2_FULL_56_26]OGH03598.1 MAG: hypothetical protein A2426_06540 [Candidatus Lambdaproteobacteria bacterium RIFOXYC1_FULL_56_13]OGH08735.1 MAG: hypothetical protein A2600_09225 [Candidatus Lambdaproteobacteria bacterium RIFOXYD1_FULL_56_27]